MSSPFPAPAHPNTPRGLPSPVRRSVLVELMESPGYLTTDPNIPASTGNEDLEEEYRLRTAEAIATISFACGETHDIVLTARPSVKAHESIIGDSGEIAPLQVSNALKGLGALAMRQSGGSIRITTDPSVITSSNVVTRVVVGTREQILHWGELNNPTQDQEILDAMSSRKSIVFFVLNLGEGLFPTVDKDTEVINTVAQGWARGAGPVVDHIDNVTPATSIITVTDADELLRALQTEARTTVVRTEPIGMPVKKADTFTDGTGRTSTHRPTEAVRSEQKLIAPESSPEARAKRELDRMEAEIAAIYAKSKNINGINPSEVRALLAAETFILAIFDKLTEIPSRRFIPYPKHVYAMIKGSEMYLGSVLQDLRARQTELAGNPDAEAFLSEFQKHTSLLCDKAYSIYLKLDPKMKHIPAEQSADVANTIKSIAKHLGVGSLTRGKKRKGFGIGLLVLESAGELDLFKRKFYSDLIEQFLLFARGN